MSIEIQNAREMLRLGRRAEARKLLESLPQKDAETWHLLGIVYFRDGDAQRAESAVRRAIDLSREVAEFHNTLGVIIASTG